MKPAWFLEIDLDTPKALEAVVREQNMDVYIYGRDRPTSHQGPLVFAGSIEGMQNVQRMGWPHGYYLIDWCDWRQLRCSTYYAKWGQFLLSEQYGFYPLAELRRMKKTLSYLFGHGGKLFIRPDTNDKIFSGGVVSWCNLDCWLKMADKDKLEDTLLCVVAHVEPITAEYRVMIADGKAIACSRYILGDYISYEEGCKRHPGATQFAEEIAKTWTPHRIFVLDIAYTYKDYRLIECGSVNTADFYSCDLKPIVEAMSRIAREEF